MGILTDALPETVEIGGEQWPVDTGYRGMIRFEMLMQDRTVPEQEKVLRSLADFYTSKVPRDLNAAVERLLWFYRCGKEELPAQRRKRRRAAGDGPVPAVYSFDYDDEYIYAAFLDQYGVDLQQQPRMHWWKFKALFKALRPENEFVKIMGYRGMTIDNKLTDAQKAYYTKMKEVFRLPVPDEEQRRLEEIERILMGDGKF